MVTVAEWKQLFANNTINSVYYKGTSLDKVVANGATIWENWVEKTGQIANLSTSSNADWFSTNEVTFTNPIIPKQIYCYFSYNYGSSEEYSSSTSIGGGLNYTCQDGTTNASAPFTIGIGTGTVGRPSSGTASKTTTLSDEDIAWFKQHGGIVRCHYNGGGGALHGTQSCGGYINGYLQKGG